MFLKENTKQGEKLEIINCDIYRNDRAYKNVIDI